MQKHQVEVRIGTRLGATHTTDRSEGESLHAVGDGVEVFREARTDEIGKRPPALTTWTVRQLDGEFLPLTLEVPHPHGMRDLSVRAVTDYAGTVHRDMGS